MQHDYHIKPSSQMSELKDIITANIEQIIAEGETFKMVVTGYSMLPLLGYGRDTIVVRRTAANEDIVGRIAMFRAVDGHIIVHRVIGVKGDKVVLRGDGNLAQCEKCRRGAILGVVESVVRESQREVSCTSRWWRVRERIWLAMPMIVRRYALGVIRRLANLKRK
jgi:SOS-response transcriptional repressor LexA